jgi:hypothetical protein
MVDIVVALIVLGLCAGYISISSFIVTQVINDLRLDTYIDFSTGFGIVSLVLLLVWAPIWLMRERRLRR